MDHKLHSENSDFIPEDLTAKYLSGNISSEERTELLSWAEKNEDNRQYFDDMIHLWAASEQSENDFEANMDQAWNKISGAIEEKPILSLPRQKTSQLIVKSRRNILIRIAAAVLFLMVATYWWTSNGDEAILIQTALNEQREVFLPDGTIISLNQNSEISYNKSFKNRNVQLKGEAFFDVVRDEGNPFVITSGATQTRVLGTSFNVRAYPNDEEIVVTVTSGKVEFKMEEKPDTKVVLKKNEAGVFTKKEAAVAKKAVTSENSVSWKTKILTFENIQLREVFPEMERHFGIDIEVQNQAILDCDFMGTYEHPKLDDLIEAMNYTLGLTFEKKGNKYLVSGNACKQK